MTALLITGTETKKALKCIFITVMTSVLVCSAAGTLGEEVWCMQLTNGSLMTLTFSAPLN